MEGFHEQDHDSSSDSSEQSEENIMDFNDSGRKNSNSLENNQAKGKRVEKSCFRQYLSLMSVHQRSRIGSLQTLSGLGHGSPINPPSSIKEMLQVKYCKHPPLSVVSNPLFKHPQNGTSTENGAYKFCNNPNCHDKCAATNGNCHEGNCDEVLGLKRPIDDDSTGKGVGGSSPKRKAAGGSDAM